MKRRIRILSLLVGAMLIFLAGCGKSADKGSSADIGKNEVLAGETSVDVTAEDMDFTFTDRERDPEKSLSSAITLTDKKVTIKKACLFAILKV